MTVTPTIAPVSATGVVHGEVITQRWVVEMILDLVGYTPDRDLAALRIIEPSAGTGAFLDAIVDRLLSSVSTHHRDAAVALAGRCISANELQPGNAAALRPDPERSTGMPSIDKRPRIPAHRIAVWAIRSADTLSGTSPVSRRTCSSVSR